MAGVSVRTLHHYDDLGLLKPALTTESGHRLYAPAQLARLRRILALKTLGLTLDEIGRVPDGLPSTTLLARRRAELLAQRDALDGQIRRLDEVLCQERRMEHYQVELKDLPAYPVLAARGLAPDYRHVAAPMGELFGELGRAFESTGLRCVQPCAVVWHGGGYQSEEQIELEVAEGFEGEVPESGLPGGRVHRTELPATQVASTVHTGSYERLGEPYAALLAWMAREGFVSAGPVREVYLQQSTDEAGQVTELQIPVRRV